MSVDIDQIEFGDSTESDFPASRKTKIEVEEAPKAERRIRLEQTDDPECKRQRDLFYQQFDSSEGFDVDWNSFDYAFSVYNFDWTGPLECHRSNTELMKALIQAAVEYHDEEYGTELECVKYVGANLVACKGLLYYITFSAKDVASSDDQEARLYQAKVWKFAGEISVQMVRLRPTQLPS